MLNRSKFDNDERRNIVDTASNTLFAEDGLEGRNFLKDRGISKGAAEEFKLGYCPKIGLTHLANRVIIPCFDLHGNPVAISTRKLTHDESEKPHWWNEVFNKKKHLFGLYHAYPYIIEKGYVILVEGQFDVISLFQRGVKNVVGLMGSSFSSRRLSLLRLFTKSIVILMDEDWNQSGQKAAAKMMEVLTSYKFPQYVVAKLPTGYDPDSYIREKGAKELLRIVDKAREDVTIDSHEALRKTIKQL